MEIHIERIKHQIKNEGNLVSEKVAILPYVTGKHEVEGLGAVELKISKFNHAHKFQKVVFISESIKTKKSEKDRRVVKFPKDTRVSVYQEITPEEKLVFKRVKEKLKGGE